MKILENSNLVSVAEPDAKRISWKGAILVLIVAVVLTLLAHELDRKIQPR
jgi:hypothetical protein